MAGLKLAITGKGGVGKTTFTSTLALLLARDGYQVTAVDADPAVGLAAALGVSQERAAALEPIAGMRELILERTAATPGTSGGYFKLNPQVADLPEKFGLRHQGVRLLVMGGMKPGGAGCMCPENALLQALTAHLVLGEGEFVLLDMEAGIEHLTRGTARGVDGLIVVVEPGRRSLEVAGTIRRLAGDLGLPIYLVGNKVRGPEDEKFLTQALGWGVYLGSIPYAESVIRADQERLSLVEADSPAVEAVEAIMNRILKEVVPRGADS